VELSGAWRAAVADEALRRAFTSPGFDDAAWVPVEVPGHWRSVPAFAESDGPLLYRRPFEADRPEPGRRSWLTLDGVFYDGDVWLDGSYVGATEGYFFPHTFEVTEGLAAAGPHLLAVEVACSPPSDPTAKRNLTGVFQHWDCLDPTWNPGGIWRDVRLSETGPVRIASLRVLCAEATAERAVLSVRAELDAATATSAVLRVTVAGPSPAELVTRHALAHGTNRIRVQVPVDRPALWWPHALGDQPLHDVTVEILLPLAGEDAGGRSRRWSRTREEDVTEQELDDHHPSDARTLTTGLRQVRMKNFLVTVNGERLFVKGSNHGPTRMALSDATPAELERDVVLAREAGLDLLRIHAHITRTELYEAADRHGLLLWQDLPLQWGYARSVRKQAVRQAREAVDVLGHHPAVAIWCGHNEPLALDNTTAVNPARFFALQELPTWNKTVLDTSISRALERADPTRPVVSHSGVLPGPLSSGTDTHLYCGWYHGSERDLPRILAAVPRLGRFLTEFGAQAVPDAADFAEPQRWPDLDWERLAAHHSLQREPFEKFVPPGSFRTFDGWRQATQAYQATVLRFHIETIRRLKYRPAGGFCQFCFADGHPAITWSVLDHERNPKAGYGAMAAACAPVIVVADRPAESYAPGATIELAVHVVSDLRRPLDGVRVIARLGAWRAGWGGDIPADSVVKIGTVQTTVPPVPGPVSLVLRLEAGGFSTTNVYETRVAHAG